MKKLAYALIVLLLAGCSNGAPIINFENQQIKRFDNKTLTDEEIQTAIRKAANRLGWKVEPGDQPNHIIATLTVRNQHIAIVDISYTRNAYSVNYKDSVNLLYKNRNALAEEYKSASDPLRIHPNYNKWVGYLNDEIYKRLQE